ncbi:hypothetical protein AX16_009328 [Volvariella volvacea WC 439]|nr:hypothetical protein AX16_009328 [Volvariella volvacea WC 439]
MGTKSYASIRDRTKSQNAGHASKLVNDDIVIPKPPSSLVSMFAAAAQKKLASSTRFPLETRVVGGVPVSEVGAGLMTLSALYNDPATTRTDEERFRFLDALLESGCNFWDTADIYGDCEELLGKWFRKTGARNRVFLATKFGFTSDPNKKINASPEYVKEAARASLERLGVDYIDLYYAHRVDPTVPIEHTVSAMAELLKEGKVRHLGLSDVSAETLRRAYKIHPIAAVQVEYSPFTLSIEDPKVGILQVCRELGVTIVAYAPLGRGLLTGTIRSTEDFLENDFRRTVPRYAQQNFPRILEFVDLLKELARLHQATPAQICLAWVLAQGRDIIPIPGTSKIKYLHDNLKAARLRLSMIELAEIRRAAETLEKTTGDRYSVEDFPTLLADTPPLKA